MFCRNITANLVLILSSHVKLKCLLECFYFMCFINSLISPFLVGLYEFGFQACQCTFSSIKVGKFWLILSQSASNPYTFPTTVWACILTYEVIKSTIMWHCMCTHVKNGSCHFESCLCWALRSKWQKKSTHLGLWLWSQWCDCTFF